MNEFIIVIIKVLLLLSSKVLDNNRVYIRYPPNYELNNKKIIVIKNEGRIINLQDISSKYALLNGIKYISFRKETLFLFQNYKINNVQYNS